jgi:hypothetical protein
MPRRPPDPLQTESQLSKSFPGAPDESDRPP